MTREEAKEFLPIIEAFSEGKTIQYRYKGRNIWEDDGKMKSNLNFLASTYEYRIKPESKYVPFTYEDRELFRGKWIKNKQSGDELLIVVINSNNSVSGFTNQISTVPLKDGFMYWCFLDGTPFGKLVEV